MEKFDLYVYHSECMCSGWIFKHKMCVNPIEIRQLTGFIGNDDTEQLAIVSDDKSGHKETVKIQYPMNCYPEFLRHGGIDGLEYHIVAISLCESGPKYSSPEIRQFVIDNFHKIYEGQMIFGVYWVDKNDDEFFVTHETI